MNHNEFFIAIRNNSLWGAYLLHGIEEYTKARAMDQLIGLIPSDFRAMNLNDFSIVDCEPIIAACDTYPLFSEKRLVIVRATPTGEAADRMLTYIDSMNQSTILIFISKGAVSSMPKSAVKGTPHAKNVDFRSEMEKRKRCVLFDTLPDIDLIRWIMRECTTKGVTITKQLAEIIIRRTGTSLTSISNETAKLIEYVGVGNSIDRQAIALCVTQSQEYRLFDMLDYFNAGKAVDGFKVFHAMLNEDGNIMGMITYLLRQLKLMYKARMLIDAGVGKADAAKRIGGAEFAAKKAYDAAKRFTQAKLLCAIEDFSGVTTIQFSGGGKAEELIETYLIKHFI